MVKTQPGGSFVGTDAYDHATRATSCDRRMIPDTRLWFIQRDHWDPAGGHVRFGWLPMPNTYQIGR